MITAWPSTSRRTFVAFISLCTTPALCKKSNATKRHKFLVYAEPSIPNKTYLPIAKATSATYILTTFSGKQPHCSISENSSPPPI